MSPPLISIITPTYNHSAYIADCVRSVLNQTYTNWQQIIVDDGSSDDTAAIACSFQDDRIEVIRQDHRGLAKLADTYNSALERCDGSLIAILEGDDFWPSDKLEITLPFLSDESVVLAYGMTQLTTTAGRPLNRFIPDQAMFLEPASLHNIPLGSASLVLATGKTFCFPVSTVMRASALREVGGFQHVDGLNYVDLPTFLRLTTEGPFAFVPRVAGYWRQRFDSGTRTRDETEAADALTSHLKGFFEEYGWQLTVDIPDYAEMARHIQANAADLLVGQARRLLLRKQWPSARATFVDVLRHPHAQGRTRRRALAGILFSYLHMNLEPLARFRYGAEGDLRHVYLSRERPIDELH